MATKDLDQAIFRIMQRSDAFIPTPLIVNESRQMRENWQELLARYYMAAGANTIVPGAHTGQFALNNLELYGQWLDLNKRIIEAEGRDDTFLMAAISGPQAKQMAQLAADKGYHIVMVAPSAYAQHDNDAARVQELREIADIIPVYGFYLQKSVGGIELSENFWKGFFEFGYGAKLAPFDRELTDVAMKAAADSGRELVMSTGNDDDIVGDFLLNEDYSDRVQITAGLLGHWATDTHANIQLARFLKQYRQDPSTSNPFGVGVEELAADSTAMNYAVFDTMNLRSSRAFTNSVWGVQYRLGKLGLMPTDDEGYHIFTLSGGKEKGRPGLSKEIDLAYGARDYLTDNRFVAEKIQGWKEQSGV